MLAESNASVVKSVSHPSDPKVVVIQEPDALVEYLNLVGVLIAIDAGYAEMLGAVECRAR